MPCLRPTKRFGVIYADPPWNFKNFSPKGTGRNAIAHYECMDFGQIAALQPQRWAAKDCVLFLWATESAAAEGFRVPPFASTSRAAVP